MTTRHARYLCAGAFNERLQVDVSGLEIGLHVVVVVSVPRREDDAVVLGRAEVYDDVVGVRDLCRLNVDLKVLSTAERHDRRHYTGIQRGNGVQQTTTRPLHQ